MSETVVLEDDLIAWIRHIAGQLDNNEFVYMERNGTNGVTMRKLAKCLPTKRLAVKAGSVVKRRSDGKRFFIKRPTLSGSTDLLLLAADSSIINQYIKPNDLLESEYELELE